VIYVSDAVWAYGTYLSKGGVVVAELTSIGSPELDSDEIEVTHLLSPGGYEEVIQGIRRTGIVTLEGNYVSGDAGQADMMASYLSGAVETYKITFPAATAAEWTFDAFVKKAPAISEAATDGALTFSAELRVTGQPTLDITYSDNLTGLAISDCTLTPAFAAATYDYVGNVAAGIASVTFTVTGAGVLTVNGVTVSTGVASGAFALGAAGSVTDFTVVTKETNKIAKTYTVKIARAA
jgi:predicted secreted protein